MRHRNLTIAVGCALLCAVLGAYLGRTDDRVLGPNPGLTRYGDTVLVQVPFRRDDVLRHVRVLVDGSELLSGMPVLPVRYGAANLYAPAPAGLAERATVTVVLDTGEQVSRRVRVASGRLLGMSGTAQDAMRSMPDMAGPGDRCAPVAAANSLIALAKRYGADAKLPAMPDTVIAELSDDMRWQAGVGVTVSDYVAGANLWAMKKGLPVTTTLVGRADGGTTVTALAAAPDAQVELVWTDAAGARYGAHAVSARVLRDNDTWYLFASDPLSPPGTDVYRIDGTRLIGYPYTGGRVSVGRGFVQTWTKPVNN